MNSRKLDVSADFDYLLADVLTKEVQVTARSNPRRIDRSSGFGVRPGREWLSYTEAAELVGLGRTTLWKLAVAGEIEVAHVGRARRISRESLIAYMRRSAEGGAVAAE